MSNEDYGNVDLSLIISALALAISFLSLVWTLLNQRDQNKRWDATNMAEIVLSEAKLLMFDKGSKKELFERQWGYDALFCALDDPNEGQVLSCLKIVNIKSNQAIQKLQPILTVPEAEKILRLLQIPLSEITLIPTIRPNFKLLNIGNSIAKDVKTTCCMRHPRTNEWEEIFTSNSNPFVPKDQSINFYFDVGPPDLTAISTLHFRLQISYNNIHDETVKLNYLLSWDASNNYWYHTPNQNITNQSGLKNKVGNIYKKFKIF